MTNAKTIGNEEKVNEILMAIAYIVVYARATIQRSSINFHREGATVLTQMLVCFNPQERHWRVLAGHWLVPLKVIYVSFLWH